MSDHLGRDSKDFAIEFGEYLAKAAENFQKAVLGGYFDSDALSDSWSALNGAIHEFRARAAKAKRDAVS